MCDVGEQWRAPSAPLPPSSCADVLTVAAAMLRYGLGAAAPCLRLEANQVDGQAWLRLSYPARALANQAGSAPRDLMLIDSCAARWGHCGNDYESTLWALVDLGTHVPPITF